MFELNGEIIKGDEVAVISYMKEQVYDGDRFASLDEYMDFVAQNVWKFHGKSVIIQGDTLADRCACLVQQLIEYKMIEPVDV